MDLVDWLRAATEDALKRELPELVPLLEGLAASTAALRTADDTYRRDPEAPRSPRPEGR